MNKPGQGLYQRRSASLIQLPSIATYIMERPWLLGVKRPAPFEAILSGLPRKMRELPNIRRLIARNTEVLGASGVGDVADAAATEFDVIDALEAFAIGLERLPLLDKLATCDAAFEPLAADAASLSMRNIPNPAPSSPTPKLAAPRYPEMAPSSALSVATLIVCVTAPPTASAATAVLTIAPKTVALAALATNVANTPVPAAVVATAVAAAAPNAPTAASAVPAVTTVAMALTIAIPTHTQVIAPPLEPPPLCQLGLSSSGRRLRPPL